MQLDETQLKAVAHAVESKFSVITGGAGTGKTTIIRQIYGDLKRMGYPIKMCAFAGKAAARLKEATGEEASTIHRLLGYNGVQFTLESLRNKCVIVDEASMVDSEIMAEIIKREPEKLILVGDAAQLPPVGKGQPFHDIIELRPDVVVMLTKCYRNSEAVFKAATAIREGRQALDQDTSENEMWRIVNTGNDQQTHAAVIAQVRNGFFDFTQDIILCPKNGNTETLATVESLNADIANIVIPREEHERFVVGDRIMNTKNISEKDVWNGTTGSVHAIDTNGAIWMKLDEPVIDWEQSSPGNIVYTTEVQFTKKEAMALKLAYALSVHKSQGSQYRKVCFVCLGRDSHALLSRPLIYTAVTRTRQTCIVVGEKYAFQRGCENLTKKSTIIQELASAN